MTALGTLLGYPALVLLGVVLGLIGAGGSILVVPILVYLFGVAPTTATGYSLLIVGVTALSGAVTYLRRGDSDPKMAGLFGAPAIVGVYVTRRWLFPAVPDPIAVAGLPPVAKDTAVMVLFAAFMLAAAASMMRRRPPAQPTDEPAPIARRVGLILPLGFTVGVFTGIVGAGGGFMILPVLVLLGGLPMKVAIGTDLIVIAAKSLIGFVGEVQVAGVQDARFLATLLVLPVLGMVIGARLNRRVPAAVLQTAFGWFILVMGSYIVIKEVLLG